MKNTNMVDKQKTLACLLFLDFKYNMKETNTQKKKKTMKRTNGLVRKMTVPSFFNLSNLFLSSFYFLFLSPFYLFTLGLLFFFSPDLLASFFLFAHSKCQPLTLTCLFPFIRQKWCESMLLAR